MEIYQQASITERALGYSVEEASKQTSLSKSYIRQKIRNGELEATKFGRRVVILGENLERFLRSGSKSNANDRNMQAVTVTT